MSIIDLIQFIFIAIFIVTVVCDIYQRMNQHLKTTIRINESEENTLKALKWINDERDALTKVSHAQNSLFARVELLEKEASLLKSIKDHKEKEKKPKKKEPSQKHIALSLIHEALAKEPRTLQEIVSLLEGAGVKLKRGTVNIYLSKDKATESVDGKWRLKEV